MRACVRVMYKDTCNKNASVVTLVWVGIANKCLFGTYIHRDALVNSPTWTSQHTLLYKKIALTPKAKIRLHEEASLAPYS